MFEAMRFIHVNRPYCVLFENSCLVLSYQEGLLIAQLCQQLETMGYTVWAKKVNTRNWGYRSLP